VTSAPFGVPGRLACVVDEHPRFHLEALRWSTALIRLAGVAPGDLVVHVVGSDRSDALDILRSQGVAVYPVERFDYRSPHCNKIAGALRLAAEPIVSMVVLCDADIAVLDDPRQVALPEGTIGSKPVDAPVPPLDVLREIFSVAGVPEPATVHLAWGPTAETLAGNNNGGLYLIPGVLLPQVATAWAEWAHWLLDRLELLGQWVIHVDQVAMALALAAEKIPTTPLDVRWNMPVHDPDRLPSDPPTPSVIHYHQEVDGHGFLRLTGREAIDSQIRRVNEVVGAEWNRHLPPATFRAWAHARDNTGMAAHRDVPSIVAAVVAAVRPTSILRIQPGDDLPATGTSADLTVAVDLGLLRDADSWKDAVERLWSASTRAALFALPDVGQDHAAIEGPPLAAILRQLDPDAEVYPIDATGAEVVLGLRPPTPRHPRDFGPTTLDPLVARHPDPLALADLRTDAWRTTRFYPDHAPRLWEYPVVAQLVLDELPRGSRLIDVGAGTTPLAPFLTSHGYQVDTVDPSTDIFREAPPKDDWNEWGYLDYGASGWAHRSWNCTLEELPSLPPFDGILSVSVIEHVPADVRRPLIRNIARRVRGGGLVVLTVDLVRGGDALWNRNQGVDVEDPVVHGTLQDIVDECDAVGLTLIRRETVRYWGTSHIDIALLALRSSTVPPSVEAPTRRLRALLRQPKRPVPDVGRSR
jgi:SAM-dependent methyltransferase